LENCLGEIGEIKPKTLLVIDAVYSDKLDPGEIVLLSGEGVTEEGFTALSTHIIPFSAVIEIAKSVAGVEAVYLLGISVKNLEVGFEVSPEVREAARRLAELIVSVKSECSKLQQYFREEDRA